MHRVIRNGLALGLVSALAFTLSPISPVSAATKKPAAKPAAKKPATPTVLRMTRMGDWSNAFGPSRNSSGTDHLVNFMLFDNLVKIAKDEKTILPALATKWTISKDAKKFTFELRKGVKFHDGSTFNAEDVAETVALPPV